MKTPWSELRHLWSAFEADVEASREQLRCSYRGAWFRGQENSAWSLAPGAFRSSSPPGLGDVVSDFRGFPPTKSDLRRANPLCLDEPIDPALGIVESDIAAEIRRLSTEVGRRLRQLQSIDHEIRSLTAIAGEKYRGGDTQHVAKVEKRERIVLQQRRSDIADELSAIRQRLLTLRCLRYGEKDAYILFRARTALPLGVSSWETLAAMQHYGAPTRLLDWTDALAVAIYFATKEYRMTMVNLHGSIANWLEAHAAGPNMVDFERIEEPVVWILNPFRLARFALDRNSIEDFSLRPDLDYFDCFHTHQCWPFAYAAPVTLPWRTPRMAAQRGYFTVHGTDVRGLEKQVHRHLLISGDTSADPILAKVSLPRAAAVFAVRYVVQFVGLDSFSLFRDEDNLGVTLREFMRRS
jgi:hypothetical protein